MNPDGRDPEIPGIEEVRAAYRAARPDDAPPPRVDAAILAASRRASRRALHGFLPPLAMAATLVLAVGLVLRLTTFGPERPMSEPDQEPAQRAFESEAARARDVNETVEAPAPRPPETEALRTRNVNEERAAPLEDRAAPEPSDAQRVFAPRAEPPTSAAEDAQGLAASALTLDADTAIPACSAPLVSDPDVWLACISAAVEAGALDRARSELAAFEAAYPDHAVPEAITTALEP